jgi:hypothetical protein
MFLQSQFRKYILNKGTAKQGLRDISAFKIIISSVADMASVVYLLQDFNFPRASSSHPTQFSPLSIVHHCKRMCLVLGLNYSTHREYAANCPCKNIV